MARETSLASWRLTPRTLCAGEAEYAKAAVHGVLLAAAGVCAAYNGIAWLYRRERHLAANAVIYTSIVSLEVKKVLHHLVRP